MASFRTDASACTVAACCRRLSSREKALPQWHGKGRSPVCFLYISGGSVNSGLSRIGLKGATMAYKT